MNTDIVDPIRITKYLQERISSLPSGRINKGYTGIGATTMEIDDPTRNSIIVCPTKSLAATKAKHSKIYYWGSIFQDQSKPKFATLLKDIKNNKLIKIVVVADSLMDLFAKLKEAQVDSSFFLMLDEIDSFQTESSYRPVLEECIDVYFQFKADSRCLVSATLEVFSDPRLSDESCTEIIKENYEKPTLTAIHSPSSVLKVTAKEIVDTQKPGEKILVACNSIESIAKICAILPEEMKNRVGVLCSTNSHKKIRANNINISRLEDGFLQHQVTFMTSAYFVGIDIMEPRLHVIIVADTSFMTSLLSVSKIIQILGRAREGRLSSRFIFDCHKVKPLKLQEYSNKIVGRTDAYLRVLEVINTEFNILNLQGEATIIKNSLLDSCKVDNISLLREKNGEIIISYLNLDCLLLRYKSQKFLYTSTAATAFHLRKDFNLKFKTERSELTIVEIERIAGVDEIMRNLKLQESLALLGNEYPDSGEAATPIDKRIITIKQLYSENIDKVKVDERIRSILYMDNGTAQELNKLLFQITIYRESMDSDLWTQLNTYFQNNKTYASDYIKLKLNIIFRGLELTRIITMIDTETKAVQTLKKIYVTDRQMSSVTNKYEHIIQETRHKEFCL